jgi:replicative DNA helicase
MATKTPPHNEEAEQSVLGAILIDKEAINLVSAALKADDFYNPTHGAIFGAILSLYEERRPIDLVTLSSELKKNKKSPNIGTAYLTELVSMVPTAANIEYYAKLIKNASIKRLLIQMGGSVSTMCFDEDKELAEILETAESTVFSISQGNVVRGFIPIRDTLTGSFDRIDALHKAGAGLRGVATGFTDLDNVLSGLQDSNLIILAARPGQGKTAMAINMAQNMAVKGKKSVGIFSLEMSQEELVDRLLVGQADIDAWRLKTGKLSENDFTKLSEAMGQLADAKIFIDDTPGISVNEMRTKARRLHMEHQIDVLIVDYLQLVDPGKKVENRVQEVSVVSKFLKNIARELKIPVIALSQLNRTVEHREKGRPQLSDLRESGSIEQDADVVMFLYRPEDEEQINSNTKNVKLIIAKHRNGAVGEIDLLFRGDRIRFFGVDKNRAEAVN